MADTLSIGFTLLKNAEVFAPASCGRQDVLLAGGTIAAVGPAIDVAGLPGCTVYDLDGMKLCPGIVDQHVHLTGGGGEAGPHSRTPEADIRKLVEAGITTVVGLLGTDCITRHPETLLAKVRALDHEGITAYMLTGGYRVPSPTITDSIQKDVAFIDPVIGVKTAISDHRSSVPSVAELCRLVSEARVGGLLGGKAGITVFHMGSSRRTLQPLYDILDNCDVPLKQLLPTHVNRAVHLYEDAVAYALKGGFIDITSGISPQAGARSSVKPSEAVARALHAGVAPSHLTLSSDGNGSQPVFDSTGKLTGIEVAGFDSLLTELRDMVSLEKLPLETALLPLTANVAQLLSLPKKGVINAGADADIMVLDDTLGLQLLFAKGKKVVEAGKAVIHPTFG